MQQQRVADSFRLQAYILSTISQLTLYCIYESLPSLVSIGVSGNPSQSRMIAPMGQLCISLLKAKVKASPIYGKFQ
ncbi:hypothetical protein Y1Q_0008725 [Alligator mississippiensis]|uniref:Uncharacterized protein n=1 Tax=Alligator mississippiensis TaxID=8496 RepID=A0A151N9N9_ALLMI|nr:hypothetical protein Y1Q_0008725 [Alligator mississippiensis]